MQSGVFVTKAGSGHASEPDFIDQSRSYGIELSEVGHGAGQTSGELDVGRCDAIRNIGWHLENMSASIDAIARILRTLPGGGAR